MRFTCIAKRPKHYLAFDPLLLLQVPTVVERRRGRPVGSINSNRVDNSIRRGPSAFEQNTARGRARGGRLQTPSRGGNTQISLRDASQVTS